jgi:hypothetical protein
MKRADESLRIGLVPLLVTLLLLAFSPSILAGEPPGALMAARAGGGRWVAQTKDLSVWWCESGWKVGRDTGLLVEPSGEPQPVSVSAARGEFEAAQVVLRAEKQGQLILAPVSTFRSLSFRTAPISVQVHEVAYVQVTHPTDRTCTPGWYPDPLPPLLMPLTLPAQQNQPLWLTFHVPGDAKAGDYYSELHLKTTLGDVMVPLHVHVYDFMLPEETHLKSALGMGAGSINQYHHLEQQQDKEAVYEKYLRNFAEHRISPYSFYDYAPIDVQFKGEGTNKQAQVDFTRFDPAAERWLDQAHFNTFMLPLRGMGGGTFESRHLGELEGFQEGTPEFARLFQDYLSQVEAHLAARHWLSKAFTYWFDEPAPKDFEFVADGMKRLKAAAPGVKRMLTVEPEPPLIGSVDIWCGLTPKWTPELVRQRREVSEEVWWYICCGPTAPYITEFIDHPGTELRLWPWQSWQYGVQGILIWSTLWWTSPTAFPPPKLQDPWTDPMSYVSGYGKKPGEIGYWGNGDGRFLYPPRRDPNTETSPCLDAPINSIRWENLRDGMEDYEYFWLLKQAVSHEVALHGDTTLLRQAQELLKVPPQVSTDLTHFTTDPRLILYQRDRIACMIERLRSGH